jgi:N-acetylmuramoyl-L-alanine amidase
MIFLVPMLHSSAIRRFVVLLLAFLILEAGNTAEAKKVVVLDAGHGGSDNGTKWGGVAEKGLTLDLAKRVESILKLKGIPTVMTRTTDKTLELDSRAAIANRHDSPIFVSLHFNASTNTSIKGIETYYMSSAGKRFASVIQNRLAARIRTQNRGLKQKSNLVVLRKTKGVSILVECGFISNPWERERCNSSWFRNVLAQEIAAGIVSYYKG